MATQAKDETPATKMSPRSKHAFFEECQLKHKELSKSQREYKKALNRRLKQRAERIKEMSYTKAIEGLRAERNNLRAQIYVANGRCHGSADRKCLEQIQCHIACQERLSEQIGRLKKLISKLQREKSRAEKQIYELNRRTVADARHQAHVAQVRKQFSLLENRVEVGVRHECAVTAANAALRERIKTLVANCELFNAGYQRRVQRLHDDKKYLLDLLEYASHAYEGGIEMHEKIRNSMQKAGKESEQAKLRVQCIMRDAAAAELASGFMGCKNQPRPLADLPPSELRRRAHFKHQKVRKISVYNAVLGEIYDYTQSLNIHAFIERFQLHETLYHSLFNCVNRTSFHLTALENAVEQLHADIGALRHRNAAHFSNQHQLVLDLTLRLNAQHQRNAALQVTVLRNKRRFEQCCDELAAVFNMCRADASPLVQLLGHQASIDVHNLAGFMKILERQISHIVRAVYVSEREDEGVEPDKCTVKALRRNWDYPTALHDVVLTQQCPECAEGEILNTADGGPNGVALLSHDSVKKKLYEQVNQPEMQYRLHSVSQCRLPKSRQLAARRHDA